MVVYSKGLKMAFQEVMNKRAKQLLGSNNLCVIDSFKCAYIRYLFPASLIHMQLIFFSFIVREQAMNACVANVNMYIAT